MKNDKRRVYSAEQTEEAIALINVGVKEKEIAGKLGVKRNLIVDLKRGRYFNLYHKINKEKRISLNKNNKSEQMDLTQPLKLKKNGVYFSKKIKIKYTVTGFSKIKVKNFWMDGVIYQKEGSDESYCVETFDFLENVLEEKI